MWVARYEIPRNIVTEMIPMMRSVSEAFFDCGRRNAGTPLEIASTPVRAVEPDENACRITNRPTVRTVLASSGAGNTWSVTIGQPLKMHRAIPVTTRMMIDTMNAYVGTANRVPDSRTPRRLASVTSRTNPSESSSLYGESAGSAEVIANTPATTETETVST